MRKNYRLRASADIERLRHEGRTWVHPFLVLAALPGQPDRCRFAFAVSRRMGKATRRNRIKRRMREAVRQRLQKKEIVTGWDILLIARRPIANASFQQVDEAIGLLLRRAELVNKGSA